MLELKQALATLVNVNLRTEKAGKTAVRPAADLKFSVDAHNTALDELEPGLLRALYRAKDEKGHQGDMVADAATLTTRRFPKMKPVQFAEDFPGYFTLIEAGEFDIAEIELDKVTLKSISAEPLEGGTVKLTFSLGCHPNKEGVADLYELMGKEIQLTLTAPSLSTLAELRAAAKSAPSDDDTDPDQQPLPGTDAVTSAGRAFPDAVDGRKPH